MMLSDESKVRCKAIVERMKKSIRDKREEIRFAVRDADILITAVLTMDFFLGDEMVFDSAAVERINQEIDIVNRVLVQYEL